MKRWLVLSPVPIAGLVLAAGVLVARSSGGVEAGVVAGDSAACARAESDVDAGALVSSVSGPPLSSGDQAPLAGAKCYLVGIEMLSRGCGCRDLYILRYLCYDSAKGWRYVNYWYCEGEPCPPPPCDGELDPGGGATGKYSFKDGSNCNNTSSNWVDPISVVFYGGTHTAVQQHACAHGDWCYNDGGNQRFWSYGCWDQDANANDDSQARTQ